jgi:hypothetical protein
LRGGDIDLLALVSESETTLFRKNKALVLAKIKSKSSDEQIDLTVQPYSEKHTSTFLNTIPPAEMIFLYSLATSLS